MATELLSLFAKIGIDDSEYKKGIKGAESEAKGFGQAMKAGFKVAAAAIGAATTAVVAIGKKSIQSYSEYEQMVGGVKKLYGNMGLSVEDYAKQQGKSIDEVKGEWQSLEDAQNLVLQNANNAYKTAGMSANQYMQTATSFSAALINSLNGDTVEAAKQTDVAMQAISDNWNTFGGDLGMIQGAYQGFAKQNYTMLDNLKLGYGGTKTEMERLIADANEYAKANGQAADLSIESFSDVVTAIELIQEKQNIAGTTAREAGTTIQGSLGMAKAAWENLLTGMSDKNADIGQLIGNLVTSVVGDGTDKNKGVLGNLVPVIKTTIGSIGKLVEGLGQQVLPQIVDLLPALLEELLPQAINLIQSLFTSVANILPDLIPIILDNLPLILQAGLDIILALVQGITENVDELIPAIVAVVTELVTMLTDPSMLMELINAALALIMALEEGLIQALPELLNALPLIIENIVSFLLTAIPTIMEAGLQLFMALVTALPDIIGGIVAVIPQIIDGLINAILEALPLIITAGLDLFLALIGALPTIITMLVAAVPQIIDGLVNGFTKLFPTMMRLGVDILAQVLKGIINHISHIGETVQTVFGKLKEEFSGFGEKAKEWGKDMLQGFIDGIKAKIQGLKDAVKSVTKEIADKLHFSVPEDGPLADADKWMPDFMDLLASGIDTNKFKVTNAIDGLAGDMTLDGGYDYGYETTNDVQQFEFTFADGNAPLLQIARLLFPYMQVVSKEKGVA